MKENWTYKKFSEVFNLQMGKTPSRDNLAYWGGNNVWVSIADLKDKYIESSKEQITDIAVSESGINKVPQGTAIMSFKLTIGRAAITKCDLFTNEAIMSFEPKEGKAILADYIYYYLKGCKWTGANKAVMGQTLNKKTISENIFAYPSIETQSRIVSELDLLQSIMDKQQAQLKELDNLAQAVFYDMFGDPVENDKGWEVKKLGKFCSKIGSGATPRGGNESYKAEGISLIRSLNVHNNEFVYKDLAFIDDEQAQALSNVEVQPNDILLNITGASVARCCIVPNHLLPARVNQHVCIIRPSKDIEVRYLSYLITGIQYQSFLIDLARGKAATREALPKSIVENLPIILPPLSLQQSFAAKIESIEKQKAAISQSIAETQKLFDYTMDKYFG